MCFKLRYKFSFRVVIKEGLSNAIKDSFVLWVVVCGFMAESSVEILSG